MHAMWVTHGMVHACHVDDTWHDACMPCGYVQPIKTRSVEENRGKKREEMERERKRGRKIRQFFPLNSSVLIVRVRKAKC